MKSTLQSSRIKLIDLITDDNIITDYTKIFIRENGNLIAKGNWYQDDILNLKNKYVTYKMQRNVCHAELV